MDHAYCLLHTLPRESNLADEGKVDMAISWNANRSVEIGLLKNLDLNEFARHQHMARLRNIYLLSRRLRVGVRPTEQKQADTKDAYTRGGNQPHILFLQGGQDFLQAKPKQLSHHTFVAKYATGWSERR